MEYSRALFSAVFRPSHVPKQKYLGNLIHEFGWSDAGGIYSLNTSLRLPGNSMPL